MLAHELTHIKRHDVAKKLLLTLVCILHWYNPAVWLLSARAARDIEEACDAETLHGRDAAYRAAYADALMTAVRRNCGPCADKRLFPEQAPAQAAPDRPVGHRPQAPRPHSAGCAGPDRLLCGRAGCLQARRCDPQDEQKGTCRHRRAGTVRNGQPHRDTGAAACFDGGGQQWRGADFLWSEYLTDGNGYYYHGGACGLVVREDYDTEYISALLETRRDDGTTQRDYLNDGQGALVKATFEAELTPEGWYLQTMDGEDAFMSI